MATEPLVSVIIPTYNQARFLGECLASLLAQTHARWEAIIINNFSTDDTLAVVGRYADERIRLINFKNNGIIAASRNQGLRAARGEYIAFLDSDDLWFPDKLERQLKAFNNDPSVHMIATNGCWFTDVTKRRRYIYRTVLNKRISFRAELLFNRFINSAVMLRRGLLDTAGYLSEDPLIAGSEDYEYWLRVLHQNDSSGLFLATPLALIREHGSNTSASFYGGDTTIVDKISKIYEGYQQSEPQLIARARMRITVNMINAAVHRGAIPIGRVFRMQEIPVRYRIEIFMKTLIRRLIYGGDKPQR